MRRLLIKGISGLGDAILERPFVRAALARWDEVYLETSYPQVYVDMPALRFVKSVNHMGFYVYRKNMARFHRWHNRAPPGIEEVTLCFSDSFDGFQATLERQLPLGATPYQFDLPDFGPSPIVSRKPIAVVRPVTLRIEWTGPSRNPLPEYVAKIAGRLMDTHHVVTIADLEDGKEWAVPPLPPCHEARVHGELSVEAVLALIQHADVCIGGVGFLTVAALAARVPLFTILGGLGRHNSVERITDPRMDLSRAYFAVPDNFCRCDKLDHDCPKTISNLLPDFDQWWRTINARG